MGPYLGRLPFDADAAVAYATIGAARRKAGRPISVIDAQIAGGPRSAAIARARGATLATRNVEDFAGCSITLVDPWTA